MALRTLGLIAGSDVAAMATWVSASAVVVRITGSVQLGFFCGAVTSARGGVIVAALANAAILAAHTPDQLYALRFLTGAGLADRSHRTCSQAAYRGEASCWAQRSESRAAGCAIAGVGSDRIGRPQVAAARNSPSPFPNSRRAKLAGAIERQAGWSVAFVLLSIGPAIAFAAMLVLQRRLQRMGRTADAA